MTVLRAPLGNVVESGSQLRLLEKYRVTRKIMAFWKLFVPIGVALAIVLSVNLVAPKPAEAFIDEIIAAICNGGDEVVPPGQVRDGESFVRALRATGFITDIDESVPGQVTVNFDPTVPNSKFRDRGVGDVTIPNGIAPGVDLILSPGIEPDPNFPAHAHCRNLNP